MKTFVVKFRCERGHAQELRYGEGFSEDAVHDHAVLVAGGTLRSIGVVMPGYPCAWQDKDDAEPCGGKVAFEIQSRPMPVDRSASTTTDGRPLDTTPDESGQQKNYVVLTAAERAKGFVRPVRRSYVHVGKRPKHPTRPLTDEERPRFAGDAEPYVLFEIYPADMAPRTGRYWTEKELKSGCGTTTTMGRDLAETYARDPTFYSGTFCATCRDHFSVGEDGEFVWAGTTEKVGT